MNVFLIGFKSGFVYSDPEKQLRYKYLARNANSTVREAIAKARGVRYTELDSFVNWQGARSLPPDVMHLFFLGSCIPS